MQIKEIALKNFKCLENYDTKQITPLQFENLNIFVGENDSGKSSILEALQIFFGIKKIEESMFRDKQSEVIIQVKMDKVDRYIFNEALRFRKWNIDYYKFFSQISEEVYFNLDDEYLSGIKIKGIKFLENLENLKNFSFYDILKNFYSYYIENLLINITEHFYLQEVKEDLPDEEEVEILPKKKDILASISANFDFDLKSRDQIEILLSNKYFSDFMTDFLNNFESKCVFIAGELINQDKKFNIRQGGLLGSLKTILSGKKENPEYIFNYEALLNFIKDSYSNNIFSNDNEKDILSKIAYNISIIINKRNFKNAKWSNERQLNVDDYLNKDYELMDKKTEIYRDFEKYKKTSSRIYSNILDYFIPLSDHQEDPVLKTLPKPEVYLFDKEVAKDTVTRTIFENFCPYDALKYNIYLALKTGLEANFYGTQYSVEEPFNEHLSKINKNLKFLNENIGNIEAKIGIKNFVKITDYIEPLIEIFTTEKILNKNENVLIEQKGQGFLRKLMLADFLTIISEDEKKSKGDYKNPFVSQDKSKSEKLSFKKSRILMLEEPELHLHPGAQRKLMKVLKEKLAGTSNQVFFTSHSSFILEESSYENVYVLKKDKKNGISTITRLKQNQFYSDKEALHKLKSSLGVKDTDLLFFKKIILILEGSHDVAFIKGLCKRPEFNINTENILFIEAAGQANIAYYAGLGDYLNIKTIIVYDYHQKNLDEKKKIESNPFLSLKLREKIIKIVILSKTDILNYLNIKEVCKYLTIPEEFLKHKPENMNLKDILVMYNEKAKSNIKLYADSVEYLANKMEKVDKELIDKIMNILKIYLKP